MTNLTEDAQMAGYLMQLEAKRLQHQCIGPEHLLLGLLRDASDPAGTGLYPNQRRYHAYLGVPVRGPHPVRLLIEGCGVALETLLAAVRVELDRSGVRRGGRG
jgi:Clp amino terminal domain, pathogenicity island component